MSRPVRDLDRAALRAWPLPEPAGSKDARGRVVVVGGSRRTPGAVLLAAEAAVRAGAGKPQIATVASAAVAAGIAFPEALVTALPETDEGEISPGAAARVVDLAADCDALLLGPGLLSPSGARSLLEDVVSQVGCPVVVDASAMAYLTEHVDGVAHLEGRAVLTPNLSELAHTLHRDEGDVQARLVECCVELSDRSGATVVTGGAETLVVAPGGDVVWSLPPATPGLGVAGSGDVKAGVVAGLLARGLAAEGAAVWAVSLHHAAGRTLSRQEGPVGFLARELLAWIPREMLRLSAVAG